MVSSFVETEARRAVLAERAVLCAESAELDRLTEMAAETFQVSHAAISVSDGNHQAIIAGFGLDDRLRGELEQVVERACAGGLAAGPDRAVQDAGPFGRMAFIQCAPLTSGGVALGCLAIADENPRHFSTRGAKLMEKLAAFALDQLYLVCVARSLVDSSQHRLEEVQAVAAQNRSLKQRLNRIARLGRIGGWVLDMESDQILWTDELPGGLALEKASLGPEKVVSLYDRSAREQIRRALRRTIEHGVPLEVEHPVRLSNGETCWVRMLGEFEPGHGASGRVIGIVQDVSERYRADEKISYLSHYDPTTGLPNRTLFQDRLQAAVRWAGRTGDRGAVLVLDIDGFCEINDALGYEGGDAVLARLAERLSATVRACDSVARIGGDRFGIIMSGMEAAGDVMKLAERLLGAGSEMPIEKNAGRLAVSIGIGLFPTDGSTASQLLHAAETALDRAKHAGGGQYSFFTAEMGGLADRRRQLMTDVRAGLEADQFVVAYQPKIDLRTNGLAGFEALIRWAHPERGLLSPGEFWEALSDPTLGTELSNAVLAKVASQIAQWRRAGADVGAVAVNVAAGQLRDPGFLDQIRQLLRQWDLPPSAVSLELTESVLLGRRSDRTVRALNAIHQIGVGTELDDFGTGYASLTHLRQFPVNRLKIDRSFVTDLATSPENETIVRAVIEMAHGLHMKVVAEGVETAEADQRLRQLGCDFGQGFFYAKPMLADQIPTFLQEWESALGGCPPLRLVKS